jgi:hypothetical protein
MSASPVGCTARCGSCGKTHFATVAEQAGLPVHEAMV